MSDLYIQAYDDRETARAVAEILIAHQIEARVTPESDGRFVVRVPGAFRSLARDILDGGGASGPRTARPAGPRLDTFQFVLVSGVGLVLFLAWIAAGAPGGRTLFIVVATAVVTVVGLWVVAPEFYEIVWMRMLSIEFLAAGVLVVLGYRLLFDLLPIGAAPYRSYALWEWLLGSIVLNGVIAVVSIQIVRRTSLVRIRRTMVVFGVVGLGVGIAASATYLLDMGYTAERWGLVSVWAVIGIYPLLSVPIHAMTAGILGWGWALTVRTGSVRPSVQSFMAVALAFGIYNHAVVRSPFWGPLAVIGLVVVWARLFARHPEFDPMVDRIPQHLLERYATESGEE